MDNTQIRQRGTRRFLCEFSGQGIEDRLVESDKGTVST